jgi:pyruvate ferredoxin oxidoreductase gamma subunit/2-oxoisovalerate ferredoxin oxidoreductase gamma subunit
MAFLLEIRFHGRGGQGAVTAANLFASAALKAGNKDVQAFPFFGAERRGAPVKAFARISDEEINLRSPIYEPDMVVALDPYLLELVEVTEGLKLGGTFLLNTGKRPEELSEFDKFRVATVNATEIALKHGIEVGGIPVVNTAILGAIPKLVSRVTLEAIIQAIKDRFKGEQGEINAKATREAYKATLVKE